MAQLAKTFDDPIDLIDSAELDVPPNEFDRVVRSDLDLASKLRSGDRVAVRRLVKRVELGPQTIVVRTDPAAIAEDLGTARAPNAVREMAITIDAQLRRTGKVVRFIDGNDEPIDAPGPQPHLVRLLVQARAWWTEMLDEQLSFSELAERHSIDRGYLSKVVRLNFLAPTIVDQILSGQLSTTINARTLLRLRYFPIDWDEQQRQLRSF